MKFRMFTLFAGLYLCLTAYNHIQPAAKKAGEAIVKTARSAARTAARGSRRPTAARPERTRDKTDQQIVREWEQSLRTKSTPRQARPKQPRREKSPASQAMKAERKAVAAQQAAARATARREMEEIVRQAAQQESAAQAYTSSRVMEAEAIATPYLLQQIQGVRPDLLVRAMQRPATQRLIKGEVAAKPVGRVAEGALSRVIPKEMRTDIQQTFYQMFKDLPPAVRAQLREHMYREVNKDIFQLIERKGLSESEAKVAFNFLSQQTHVPLARPFLGKMSPDQLNRIARTVQRESALLALPKPQAAEALPARRVMQASPAAQTSIVPFTSGNVTPFLINAIARGESPFVRIVFNPTRTANNPHGTLYISHNGTQTRITDPKSAEGIIPKNYHHALRELYKSPQALEILFWRPAAPLAIAEIPGASQELADLTASLATLPIAGLLIQGSASRVQEAQEIPAEQPAASAPTADQPSEPTVATPPVDQPPEPASPTDRPSRPTVAAPLETPDYEPSIRDLFSRKVRIDDDILEPAKRDLPGLERMLSAYNDQLTLIEQIQTTHGLGLEQAEQTRDQMQTAIIEVARLARDR